MLLAQFLNFYIENTCLNTANTSRHSENACIVQRETFRDSKQTVYSTSLGHYPETRQSSPCRKRIPPIQTFSPNYNSRFLTILNAVIINT